jgi:hemolysin III
MSQANWPFLGLRDPVSSGTHFAACLWAIFGTLILWRLTRGDRSKQLSLACFGLSMIALYAASATYHALQLTPEQLAFFQRLDHSAIYILIAGSYTPVFAVLIRQRARKLLYLGCIWGLAALGIACKWLFCGAPYWLTVSLYIGMGWLAVVPIIDLVRAVGVRGLLWALYGGLSYTIGGIADLVEWPVIYPGVFGYHEFFHLLAMGGTFCHFVFMVRHVVTFRGHRTYVSEPEVLKAVSCST